MDTSVIDKKTSKRGKVIGYSRDTHLRYELALDAFFAAKTGIRYDLLMVLTTTLRDPALAKRDLRYWAGGMRHGFDCHGLYGMEFNDWNFVHYNVVLRFVGKDASTSVDDIAEKAKDLWALRGHDHPRAFDYSVVWGPEGLKRYIVKSDHQQGDNHGKAEQKRLPEWLKERGTACTWWGYIGRKRPMAGDAVVQFTAPTIDALAQTAA